MNADHISDSLCENLAELLNYVQIRNILTPFQKATHELLFLFIMDNFLKLQRRENLDVADGVQSSCF
jgi:hypothetical protein